MTLLLLANVLWATLPAAVASTWQSVSREAELNEYAGSSLQLSDGRLCVVFEHVPSFLDESPKASLYFACQDLNGKFKKPLPFNLELPKNLIYAANARPLTIKGQTWIYFNTWDGSSAAWGRFLFSETNLKTNIEWLKSPESLSLQSRPWIFPTVTPQGKVLLSYERRKELNPPKGELRFSKSLDGVSFNESLPIAESAQMVRVAFFKSDTWAFAYQVGYGAQMMDYLVFSNDQGRTFTKPLPVTHQKNIHDPFLFQRKDGDLDVYYLIWQKETGFALFRRHVQANGKLGPEQRLSLPTMFVDKPYVLRLHSGNIFVTADQIIATQTGSTTTDIASRILTEDAPK